MHCYNLIDKTAVLQCHCSSLKPLPTSIDNSNHRGTGGLTSMANLRPDCHGQIIAIHCSTAATPRPTNARTSIFRIVKGASPELTPHELQNPEWSMAVCCCREAGVRFELVIRDTAIELHGDWIYSSRQRGASCENRFSACEKPDRVVHPDTEASLVGPTFQHVLTTSPRCERK